MDVEHRRKDTSLLPSQFFAEENDSSPVDNKVCHGNWRSYSGSSDFGSSSLTSTVESELGYTESESDENDEYIAELTRQMAHFMFQDDDDDDFNHRKGETPVWSNSQQQEQAKSGKLETNNKEKQEYNSSHEVSSTSASVHLAAQKPSSNSAYSQSKQALIDEQIRAVQALQLQYPRKVQKQKKSQSRKKQLNRHNQMERKGQVRQVHNKGQTSCIVSTPVQEVSMVNLQDQQKTGSDKEAVVYLGESTDSKAGSCGTGVFLPRASRNNTSAHSSKKTGCSTVIIPARVAQALKLHFDRMGPTSRSNGVGFPLQQDASTGEVRFLLQSQQMSWSKKASKSKRQQQEIGLPKEWTY